MFPYMFFVVFNFVLPVTGPNHVPLFKADGELSELNSKLLLYYTPQVNEAQNNTHLYYTVSTRY